MGRFRRTSPFLFPPKPGGTIGKLRDQPRKARPSPSPDGERQRYSWQEIHERCEIRILSRRLSCTCHFLLRFWLSDRMCKDLRNRKHTPAESIGKGIFLSTPSVENSRKLPRCVPFQRR